MPECLVISHSRDLDASFSKCKLILITYLNYTVTLLQKKPNYTVTLLQDFQNYTVTLLQKNSNYTVTLLQDFQNYTVTLLQKNQIIPLLYYKKVVFLQGKQRNIF